MNGSPSVCARCAAQYPTCCRTVREESARCFPLSGAEWEKIKPYAAARGIPGADKEENTPEFLSLMRFLFPDRLERLQKAFPVGGAHYRLPLDDKGTCLFLREQGCSLPRGDRPWYCLIFPLWVRRGFFDCFAPKDCLLTQEVKRLADIFTFLGMSRKTVKEIYDALCHDWELEDHDR